MVQTSIDWLKSMLEWNYGDQKMLEISWENLDDLLTRAKEMHKEETMDAFQAGKWDWSEHTNNGKHSMDPAEYYNETFKK
jgi:hypothetical protein